MKAKFRKLALAGFLFLVSLLFFGLNGNAYIDPSVMTYMIQVVAGLVVAIGAMAGVYLRRIRRRLSERLGVDENRNKEVESDEIILDEYVKRRLEEEA